MVTIYTTPTCAPCKVAKASMTRNDVPFESFDLTEHADKLNDLKARLGVTVLQTPIFEKDGELFNMGEFHARVLNA